MRTELESGAWVEYIPIQALKYKHKRVLERAAKMSIAPEAVGDDGSISVRELVANMDLAQWVATRQDALWALLIIEWSFDVPVPVIDEETGTVAGIGAAGEIPLDDALEIEQLLAPHAEKLTRKPDPKNSITSGSNGSSRARAALARRTA